MASLSDRRDGCVLTLNSVILILLVLHTEDDMLANRQSEHIVLFREAEPEYVSVISDLDLVCQL